MCVFKYSNLFVSFVGNFIRKSGKNISEFFPKFSKTLIQNLTTTNSFFEKMSLMKIVLKFDFPVTKWCLKRFHDCRWVWYTKYTYTHTKLFLIFVRWSPIWIVITLFWWIWPQMEFPMVPKQSKNGKYNPNLVWFKQIQKWFLFVQIWILAQ